MNKFIHHCLPVIFVLLALNINGQAIDPLFFGQNAWMPDSIGTQRYWGQLHNKWTEIGESGAQLIRYGGIAPDRNGPTNYQYIKMIDSIRGHGMEPMIQVPFNDGMHSASNAAAIVQYLNITMKRNIKYWVIANEPDHVYKYTSSSQVAPYLKAFSSAMKAVDPTIKTIGPETAWYNSGIINGLTTPGGPDDVTGKDNNGRYYIDYISFHTYPFNGSQSRKDVVEYLESPNRLNDRLATLNNRISNCNNYHNRTGSEAVKTAITEANVSYQNSPTDNLQGNGATSFVGGQFWAEILAVAMKNSVAFFNFWSVIEGNNVELNIGYLDKFNGNKQPSYYHFKMLADNFRGSYCTGTDNQANIKAFGSKSNSQVAVMILNQSLSSNHNYRLRLNTGTVSGSNTLKINIDAGISKEYSDHIQNQSSTLLVFDLEGNIMKKCEYSMTGHADQNKPPACTYYPPVANISASGPTAFCEGGSVTLNTDYIPGYTYQWKRNNENISGAVSATYNAGISGSYTVTVSNEGGNSVSSPVDVNVTPLITPSVSIVSSEASICSGEAVTFTATPENAGKAPSYQWKRNGIDVGTNSPEYTTSSLSNEDKTYCIITADANCVTGNPESSNQIGVEVRKTVATVSASGTLKICEGENVQLDANTGSGLTYQWLRNNEPVNGAVSASYKANKTGNYKVKVTESGCTSTSKEIAVEVSPIITPFIEIEGSDDFCEVSSVFLSVNYVNTGGNSFQWKLDAENIFAANSAVHEATDPGVYTVELTNKCGTVSSGGVSLAVCITTKIDEKDQQPYVKFYPNPSTGTLTVELHNKLSKQEIVKIKILNNLGQVLIQKKPGMLNGKVIEELKLFPHLAAGTYILQVSAGDFMFNTRIILTK